MLLRRYTFLIRGASPLGLPCTLARYRSLAVRQPAIHEIGCRLTIVLIISLTIVAAAALPLPARQMTTAPEGSH
ncbi:MAG TPA: hypothetical protein VNC21_01760, partial [Vicinamibacterales bacterium]|nr:hypothetical protein [Vicinamibacterales bacterium]